MSLYNINLISGYKVKKEHIKVLFFLSLQLEPTLEPKYFTMLNEIKKTQKECANND